MPKTEVTKIEGGLQNIDSWKHIAEKTPEKHIKTRPGRGGKSFSYVETGYTIQRLNELFNYMWSFRIKEERIYSKVPEVSVLGELTVYVTPEVKLVKEQYGSNAVKIGKDGKPLSISDDKKGAASDALKKCASLFGIASDIYWGGEYEQQNPSVDDEENTTNATAETLGIKKFIDTAEGKALSRSYFATAKDTGVGAEQAKNAVKKLYKLGSYTDVNEQQLRNMLNAMKKRKEKEEKVPESVLGDAELDDILGELGDQEDL